MTAYWNGVTSEDRQESAPFIFNSRELDTVGGLVENKSRFELGPFATTLTYGVEAYRNSFEGNKETSAGNSGVPNGETSSVGAFTQAELVAANLGGLPGEIRLIPGVRYDSYSGSSEGREDIEEDAWSPRLAASYAPVPWAFVFGNVGHAFRAPTILELYPDGVHFNLGPMGANYFVANPDLKPQTSDNTEFGLGFAFDGVFTEGDSLRIKASRYDTWAEDYIATMVAFGPCPPGYPANCIGTTQNENVGKAKLEGYEAELAYDARRWYARGAFSTIDGRDEETGEYLDTLAPTTVKLDAGMRFLEERLAVGGRVWLADRFDKVDLPSEERAGFAVFDVYATYIQPEGALKGVRVDLGVENIGDRAYQVVYAGSDEPGRNFRGALTWSRAW